MAPQINKVHVESDHKIFVSFRNGDTRIFDVKPYLHKGVFKELQNPAYFRKVTIIPGGITWPNDQDLSADTIYLRGIRPSSRSIKKS